MRKKIFLNKFNIYVQLMPGFMIKRPTILITKHTIDTINWVLNSHDNML